MMVTLQTILEDLNYLLGDTSVPSTGIDNQKRFINRTIENIYDTHNFSWSSCATSYAFSGTTQSLPSNYENLIEVREILSGEDNDIIYDIKTSLDQDTGQDEYVAWVTGDEVDGFTLNINQTDNPVLKVSYKCGPETLSATSDSTRIPRSMPIARGALAYMQEAEDPYRDTTQAWAMYEKSVSDLIRLDVRNNPPKKFFTKYQHSGRHMGEPR